MKIEDPFGNIITPTEDPGSSKKSDMNDFPEQNGDMVNSQKKYLNLSYH